MENLFIIPQLGFGIIASVENDEIVKYGTVDIPYKSKSVVSNNFRVVSICLDTKELKIHILRGKLIKSFSQYDFRCIAKKGNVIYLGGMQIKDEFRSRELISILDLEKPDSFSLQNLKVPIDFNYGKSIDDILTVDDKLILVDNIVYPKYLFEYDISEPSKPIHTKTIELRNNGTYEHIIKGEANKDWLILFSATVGMYGSSSYINISGKKSGCLDFQKPANLYRETTPEGLQEDDKYNFKDICLINDNLFILREDGFYFLDLNGTISKSNLIQIETRLEDADKLIKTPCNRILAVNDVDYELIN